jgi:hypothetical protein
MYQFCRTQPIPERTAMNETNDCTVLAGMAVCGYSYEVVHKLAAHAGRKHRGGFRAEAILATLVQMGLIRSYDSTSMYDYDKHKQFRDNVGFDDYHTVRRYSRKWGWTSHHRRRLSARDEYPTLNQCMPLMLSGRYVVTTRDHAFAVINGVIHDNLARRGNAPRLKARVHTIHQVKLIGTEVL